MELTTVQHIIQTPGLRGGKPHIAGRRITVSDVAFFHLKWGMSVAQIAADYDLSLASVHAALAYYFYHRAEIDQRTAEDEAFAEELEKQNPSRFQERLHKLPGE
jgi:uncharacterized protein (DUF433 family)